MTVTVHAPFHVHMTINRADEVKVMTHCSVQKEINVWCWQHLLCRKRKTRSMTKSTVQWHENTKQNNMFPTNMTKWLQHLKKSSYCLYRCLEMTSVPMFSTIYSIIQFWIHIRITLEIQRNKKHSIIFFILRSCN